MFNAELLPSESQILVLLVFAYDLEALGIAGRALVRNQPESLMASQPHPQIQQPFLTNINGRSRFVCIVVHTIPVSKTATVVAVIELSR